MTNVKYFRIGTLDDINSIKSMIRSGDLIIISEIQLLRSIHENVMFLCINKSIDNETISMVPLYGIPLTEEDFDELKESGYFSQNTTEFTSKNTLLKWYGQNHND